MKLDARHLIPGLVLLAAGGLVVSACGGGPSTIGAPPIGARYSPNAVPALRQLPVIPYQVIHASGKGSYESDIFPVSQRWVLDWSYHCAGSAGSSPTFTASPMEQQLFSYHLVPGDSPVRARGPSGSGRAFYSIGFSLLIRIQTPPACSWKFSVVDLETGGATHS